MAIGVFAPTVTCRRLPHDDDLHTTDSVRALARQTLRVRCSGAARRYSRPTTDCRCTNLLLKRAETQTKRAHRKIHPHNWVTSLNCRTPEKCTPRRRRAGDVAEEQRYRPMAPISDPIRLWVTIWGQLRHLLNRTTVAVASRMRRRLIDGLTAFDNATSTDCFPQQFKNPNAPFQPPRYSFFFFFSTTNHRTDRPKIKKNLRLSARSIRLRKTRHSFLDVKAHRPPN
jgi:hypothetical protein